MCVQHLKFHYIYTKCGIKWISLIQLNQFVALKRSNWFASPTEKDHFALYQST